MFCKTRCSGSYLDSSTSGSVFGVKLIGGDCASAKWVAYLVKPRVCILVVLFLMMTRSIEIPTWKGSWNNTINYVVLCWNFFPVVRNEKLLYPPSLPPSTPTNSPPPPPPPPPLLHPHPPPSPFPRPPPLDPVSPSHPSPTNTEFVPTWSPKLRRVNVKTCNTVHKSVPVRNTAGSYGFHSSHSLCDHHLPAFLWGQVGVFCNLQTLHALLPNTSPQPPFAITAGGTSPWETASALKTNGNHLETDEFTPKSGESKHSTRRFGYWNANVLLPSPCGLVQM